MNKVCQWIATLYCSSILFASTWHINELWNDVRVWYLPCCCSSCDFRVSNVFVAIFSRASSGDTDRLAGGFFSSTSISSSSSSSSSSYSSTSSDTLPALPPRLPGLHGVSSHGRTMTAGVAASQCLRRFPTRPFSMSRMRNGVGGLFGLRGGWRRSNASRRLIGSYWSAAAWSSRPTKSSSEQELSLRPLARRPPTVVHITGSDPAWVHGYAWPQKHVRPKISFEDATRTSKHADYHSGSNGVNLFRAIKPERRPV